MSGKSKFQISRSLDERIKSITSGSCDHEADHADTSIAYILGFNYGNVTNYVGLTTDYQLHNAGFPVVGLAYFKTSAPSDDEIKVALEPVRDYFYSPSSEAGFGCSMSKSDKNEHLFLVYAKDEESQQTVKKVYDLTTTSFIPDQPKLSVLDDAKIYNHSAIIKLTATLKLQLYDSDKKLLDNNTIKSVLDGAKKLLSSDSKNLTLSLKNSNFSTKAPLDNKQLLESFYNHLDAPKDVEQMGDYLPQMSKEDKKKLVDKWRNKVRDQRAPLEIELNQDFLADGDDSAPQIYNLDLEEYLYLHVNDSIAKSTRILLLLMRQKLELLKLTLLDDKKQLAKGEIRSCTFKPKQLNHFVPAVYCIPPGSDPNYNQLLQLRRQIHQAYLLPLDQPSVRYSQRVTSSDLKNHDQRSGYLCNVHVDLIEKSGIKGGSRNIIEGTYTYHHYLQDRIQDNGWGCAYRSLQTIISWFKHEGYIYSPDVCLRAPKSSVVDDKKVSSLREKLTRESRVPTHEEIQTVLVEIGDKEAKFVGSNKWIGSQEVCYVLNHLYDIDSKFISVSSGGELVYKARDLGQHFATQSTPIMIGGGVLAHTIIGVDFNEKNGDISYLILDPHYTGAEELNVITKKGWCGWKKNSFWDRSAFYNLCLPQRPVEF